MLKGQITIDRPGVSTRKQFSIDDIGDIFSNRVVEGDLVTLHPGDYTGVAGAVDIPPEVGVVIMPGAVVEYSDDFRLEDFSGDGAYDGPPFNGGNQPLGNGADRYLTPGFIGNVENIVDLNLGSEWAFDRQLEQLANDLNFEVIDDGSNDQFTVDISGGSNTLTFATRDAMALDFNNSQQKITIDENVPRGVQSANGLRLIEITGTTLDPNGGWKGDIDVIHKEIRAEVDGERPNPQARQQPVSRIVNEIVLHQTDRVGTTNPEPDGHVQEVRTADVVGGDDINIFETTNADDPDEIEIDITDNTVSAISVNDATTKAFLSASISNNELSISHTGGGSSFDETTSSELVSGVITDEKGHVTTLEAKEIVASTDLNVSFSSSEVTLSHADTGDADFSGSAKKVVNEIQTDGRGHVDSIGSTNLDDRYYTETEADNRFVNESGDTMSGSLTINSTIQLNNGTSVNGIDTSVGDPGSDDRLVTEQGIREAVDAAASSGVTSVEGGTDINISPNDPGEGDVTVDHANTGGAQSTGNSGGTVIQNVNTDSNGHVTGVGTTGLGSRYVKESGDTMSGSLTINSSIQLNSGTSVSGIDKSVGDPGADNRLVTEQGIREAIGAVGDTFVDGGSFDTSVDELTLTRSNGANDITVDVEPGAIYHSSNTKGATLPSGDTFRLLDNNGTTMLDVSTSSSVTAFSETGGQDYQFLDRSFEKEIAFPVASNTDSVLVTKNNDNNAAVNEQPALGMMAQSDGPNEENSTILLDGTGDRIEMAAENYIVMDVSRTGTSDPVSPGQNLSTGLWVGTDPSETINQTSVPSKFIIARAGFIDIPMRDVDDVPPNPPRGYLRLWGERQNDDQGNPDSELGRVRIKEPKGNDVEIDPK